MRFIFIAGPYTKGDIALNVRKACEAADELVKNGYVPFIPHLTHLWHLISPHPYNYWTAYDLHWLEKCDAVLRLPGESLGADNEEEFAEMLGKPVIHKLSDLVDARKE